MDDAAPEGRREGGLAAETRDERSRAATDGFGLYGFYGPTFRGKEKGSL